MPKVQRKSSKPEEEDAEEMMPHGAVNEEKAQLHINTFDNIFDAMCSKLNGNYAGALDQVI